MATKVKGEGKTTIRKRNLFTERKESGRKPIKAALARLKLRKGDGYYRQSMFGHELITGGVKRHYSIGYSRKAFKYFFIFALVKKDALAYLETHKVKKSDYLPAIHYNKKIDIRKKKIAGVDLDTAYWDMALRLGIISEKTFEKGILIPDKYKSLGLASLSSLGTDKTYVVYRKGEPTNDKVVVKGDDKLKAVYRLIRLTCFQFMQKLARKLGAKDYVAYRTDCLYYIDTPRNNTIVREFMERNKLDYKIAKEQYDPQNLSRNPVETF